MHFLHLQSIFGLSPYGHKSSWLCWTSRESWCFWFYFPCWGFQRWDFVCLICSFCLVSVWFAFFPPIKERSILFYLFHLYLNRELARTHPKNKVKGHEAWCGFKASDTNWRSLSFGMRFPFFCLFVYTLVCNIGWNALL